MAARRKSAKGPEGEVLFVRDIPSDLRLKPGVIREMIALLLERGLIERGVPVPQLVLDEAITNAIRHGNGEDPSKKVHLELRRTRRGWGLVVADEGEGFDPAQVPDPTSPEGLLSESGRGILLVRNYMDTAEYLDGGTLLWCEKRLSDWGLGTRD